MSETRVSSSVLDDYEKKGDSFYPIWFGVSCAFTALGALSKPGNDGERWLELSSQMLQGSAQLLGLLVWRIQRNYVRDGESELLCKLKSAKKEIDSLKEMRREDTKANEKAVGMFAAKEQRWLFEQRKLQQHIIVLRKELMTLVKKKEESVLELNRKLKEMEILLQCKDEVISEEEGKKKKLEEQLTKAEKTAEEFRETAKRDAQEHSTDLLKHKTAFLEVVSNQRRLEADLGRALKQIEAKRRELDLVLEQKEELSFEVVKLHRDLEQKDKLLSATLRKSKLDKIDKQMLSKEVKISKDKKKKAEPDSERWRLASGTKDSGREKRSLPDMFSCNTRLRNPAFIRDTQNAEKVGSQTIEHTLEYESPEFHIDAGAFSPICERYSTEESDGLVVTAVTKQLEEWFCIEAEKYATVIQKRHSLEIDAFVEQMKLNDEKLDAFRCRMLDMEVESKRVQSFAEGLKQEMSHLRCENKKLEDSLLQRQEEVKGLQEQLVLRAQLHVCNCLETRSNSSIYHDTVLQVKAIERNSPDFTEDPNDQPMNVNAIQSSENKLEEETILRKKNSVEEERTSSVSAESVLNLALPIKPLTKNNSSPWKKDLHALGVSYKIKRLKQHLVLLERLTGKPESSENAENNGAELNATKGFPSLLSLLNKQVSRYQSLQDRTDELCNRLHENMEKRETKTLKNFLEETLQLQRSMVASGQKSIEVQSKIRSGFAERPERLDQSLNFDTKKFTDNMNSLFQDVQRGFEVRIAGLIGDLEGTLARNRMIHIRR